MIAGITAAWTATHIATNKKDAPAICLEETVRMSFASEAEGSSLFCSQESHLSVSG
jgi:hypothetical protein